MSWSGLAKVLSGFLVAIALIIGGGYLAAQYLIAQFTAPPPKPIFANDKPPTKPKVATAAKPQVSPAASSPQVSPAASSPQVSPSVSPSPKPTDSASYSARITLTDGLNLREAPNRDSARVGGVEYNERVVVLEESPDKAWQRVRVEGGTQEGWIKAGYTERVNN